MGAASGTQGEEQKCILGFIGKPKERHRLEETRTKAIRTKAIITRRCFKEAERNRKVYNCLAVERYK